MFTCFSLPKAQKPKTFWIRTFFAQIFPEPFLTTNLKSVCLPLTTLPKNAYSMFLNFNTIQYNAMLNNKMQHNTMQDNILQGNPDGFETVWKMGNDIERSRQLSGFSVIRAKTFWMRKNFPGSNATLLPRFLGL